MSAESHHDLLSFQQFLAEQLKTGEPNLSPEEAVDVWRLQNRTSEEYREDVEAIREALSDLDAGKSGMPLDEFLDEFRRRHELDRSA